MTDEAGAASRVRPGSGRWWALALLVPTLFFVKASILGMRVFARWDSPDEVGHFAYARDLWTGNGLRPLGEAKIGADVMSDLLKKPSPAMENWIVQHPPLYHFLAGAAWKAATYVTDDSNLLFRVPRLTSAFFGAVTLFFVFRIAERMGLGRRTALAVAAGFSAVPTFTWMASGTNHDNMLAALSAASALGFVDFMISRRARSAFWSVFLMAAASITKMTALAVLVPLLAILVLETSTRGGTLRWAGRVAGLVALAAGIAGPWLVRNYLTYGDALATAVTVRGSQPLPAFVGINLLEYLRSYPVLEELIVSFFGKIGGFNEARGVWDGVVASKAILSSLGGYAVLSLVVTLAWAGKSIWRGLAQGVETIEPATALSAMQTRLAGSLRRGFCVLIALAAGLGVPLAAPIAGGTKAPWVLLTIVGLAVLAGAAVLCGLVVPLDRRRRIALGSLMIMGVFMIMLLRQLHGRFQETGIMIAVVGRYLYAGLGFVVPGVVAPALVALRGWAERAALAAAVVVYGIEAVFFLRVVIPHALASA